mgnify:CR=1 FL=1
MEINENTPLDELLTNHPEVVKVLARHGMHSIACPAELIEPLHKVCEARDMPIDKLVKELRLFVDEMEKEAK